MYAAELNNGLASAQLNAASALQQLVPELVSLSLNSKQVHWTVTGPGFLPLHQLTDEIATDASGWADLIAERAMALGFTVDARPRTVAAVGNDVPAGRIRDQDAVLALIELIDGVSYATRRAVDRLEDDPVGQDLAIQVQHGLELHRWMLRAQIAGSAEHLAGTPEWAPTVEAVR